MKWIYCLMAAMLLCIFIACNQTVKEKMVSADVMLHEMKQEEAKAAPPPPMGLLEADTVAMPNNSGNQQGQIPQKANTKPDWDKKIIKTGNISLEVKQYAAFNELVHATVKKLGGYMAQEQQNQSDYKIENSVIIKVPVDQFDNAMQLLSPTDQKILEKKISSEDVTAQLVDTKARMEAKRRVRDRYMDFLKQAKNMEDVLKVQNEINDIQETIEAGDGRISYLSHAAALSTVHLNYYQVLNVAPVVDQPSYGLRV